MGGNMSGEKVSSNKRKIEDYFGGLVNDDSDSDSHGNDDDSSREPGGERDKWVQKLVRQQILLGNCMYGNCPKCFCIGIPGYPCHASECDSNITRHATAYKVRYNQSYYLNPLFLHNLLSPSGICSSFDNQGNARGTYNVAYDITHELKFKSIPKNAKNICKEVLSCIIIEAPFGLSQVNLDWIEILAKSSSIADFQKMQTRES